MQNKTLMDIVFGYAKLKFSNNKEIGLKLAHYTSAENAINILNGKKIWLRSASVMNDHSEIEYGRDVLSKVLDLPDCGERLWSILDNSHPGLADRVKEHIRIQNKSNRSRVFIISLSEIHKDDDLGRLSMWRAYGGSVSGVAIVFNSEVFEGAQDKLAAYAGPVVYGGISEVRQIINETIEKLQEFQCLMLSASEHQAFSIITWALDLATHHIKHIGFAEEREWRITYRPFEYPASPVIEKITSIKGTPQTVYQLPFVADNFLNVPDLTLDRLLHRIVIGPSLYPETVRQALIDTLRLNNVANPEDRIVMSGIPLRLNC